MSAMEALSSIPTSSAPAVPWREHAAAGRLEDAIVGLIHERDWLSFVELPRFLQDYFEVNGDCGFGPDLPGVVYWPGYPNL